MLLHISKHSDYLVASSARIKAELNWRPRYDDLETIIRTAWAWHRQHPDGFAGI
ncbi:MAG: hypothetical protein HPY50_21975 [Firmicutes bacterium]|nr:hypothetical protein [Bacillota bacterium]